MYRTFLLASLVALLFLPLFAIDQTAAYGKWLNEDVHYIITDSERAEFVKLPSDQKRDQFIEAFWKRRDPTPGTSENEFKEEHYRRLAFSNEHFASHIPGWKTDRGRIYVVYGPPDEIEKRTVEMSVRQAFGNSLTAPAAPYEIWHYHHIKASAQDVTVKFVDTCKCGDFRREKEPSNNRDLP